MTDSLFNETDRVTIDESKDYAEELVGEGKKYADFKALAKANVYANAHIATLEKESAEKDSAYAQLREQANAGAKLQELLDKLEKQQLQPIEQTPNSNEVDMKPTIDFNQLESLFDNKLKQYEQRNVEDSNWKKVITKLEEKFGDKYSEVLQEQAKGLKLSKKEIDDMARRNPDLFFKTFDLTDTKKDGFLSPPRNTSTFSPKGEKKRNYNYYMDLNKKTPGILLSDAKLRIQMEKDAQEFGSSFYEA